MLLFEHKQHLQSYDAKSSMQREILSFTELLTDHPFKVNILGEFKFQVLFVTYTTIQRLYNQQWNESRVRSMDSANIEKTTQGK